ncbi:HNH endonuclease signature motif containing protein [Kitasatospora sp. NPDC088351]|uniref:HNH endonuclease n=1 Tax=Kitasatospora sp. NPDC088351 TaxID=3155180 RepID=UPI00341B7ABA
MVLTAHRGLCVYCGRADSYSLDHEQPVSAEGHDIWWNFMPACKACNLWKNGRSSRIWVRDMDLHHRWPSVFPGRAMKPEVYAGISARVERTQREIQDPDRRDWFRHHYGTESKPRNKVELLRRLKSCAQDLKEYAQIPWKTPALEDYGRDVCTRRMCCGFRHDDSDFTLVFLNTDERDELERRARQEGLHAGDLLGKIARQYLARSKTPRKAA